MTDCITAPARVLIVEDDAGTRRLLSTCLKYMSDYSVSEADGFDSAIAAAKEEKFDLILIDIGLSGESGLELLKQLLENGPCRAIALTGYGSDDDIEQYKEAGFVGWVIKPVNADHLLSTMKQVLAPVHRPQFISK
jgi:CheY-like chemotaxis protein